MFVPGRGWSAGAVLVVGRWEERAGGTQRLAGPHLAAGHDGDGRAGPDGVTQTGALQPLGDRGGDVDRRDARRVELVQELQKRALVLQTVL